MQHQLGQRKNPYEVPAYSLTGDLVSFLLCGLQYRYAVRGRLPATRPVQLWFGQFIHGVLEEGYRRYAEQLGSSKPTRFNHADQDSIIDLVKKRLANEGLHPRSQDLEQQGERRARACLADLSPHLYPLISHAEVRLSSTRSIPLSRIPAADRVRGVDRYEMVGVVDVITEVELNRPALASNPLVIAMRGALSISATGPCEVIVDYKGMRRPAKSKSNGGGLGAIYERQVNTYSHLRSLQPGSQPVIGGALLYVNELAPTWSDLRALCDEIDAGAADVLPAAGSDDDREVRRARSGKQKEEYPQLSLEFRLKRALLTVPVDASSVAANNAFFDNVVADIEACRGRENRSAAIRVSWPANCGDAKTCAACDFRVACPKFPQELHPELPKG